MNLDGLTILRYSHALKRGGGGLERYIEDLDQILLARNSLKVIRIHLQMEPCERMPEKRKIGKGIMVDVPLLVRLAGKEPDKKRSHTVEILASNLLTAFKRIVIYDPYKNSKLSYLKRAIREYIIYNGFLYRNFFKIFLQSHSNYGNPFRVESVEKKVREIFDKEKIGLVVMHYIGGPDSLFVTAEALRRKVPYVFVNHFSNDILYNISVREQVMKAVGIGGVNEIGIPKRLRSLFWNLSDGIDTEFFDVMKARPFQVDNKSSIIFYPARILPVKGQMDLIKALQLLRRDGIRAKVVFAGRTDSIEYEKKLREAARDKGINDDVVFTGELKREELRDLYATSSVLAFPTYHQEGLGRITIEAQAMKVPPVAYIIGGTPEGIKDGITGYLVKKGDLGEFTARIKELLIDESKRRKMGEEGRRFVLEKFSLEALAERHEKFYLSALNNFKRKEDKKF